MKRERRGASAPHRPDPSIQKLCSQAQDALSLALASARDPVLDDASIREVSPHPDASCLLVVVVARDLDAVRAALERARGYLRGELASEIHRKRAPELAFVVVPEEDAR